MKYIKLYIYFFLLLLMGVNSTKNGPSLIFELKSDDAPQNHYSNVIGLYEATSNLTNNFTAYKRLGTEMYIYVNNKGYWMINNAFSPETDNALIYSTYRPMDSFGSNGVIPLEPPSFQWRTWRNGVAASIILKWKLFDCCDIINLQSKSGTYTIKSKHPRKLGNYRKSTQTAAGRFVYKQVDGDNFLYYVDQKGWTIAKGINAWSTTEVHYISPSSCPIGEPTSDSYWKYQHKTWSNTWYRDEKAEIKCSLRNVSDKICLIENSTTVDNVETCKFPFRFRGKVYDGCIMDHADPSKAWCSTGEEIENKAYKYDDSKWGYCQQNCTTKQTISQDTMVSQNSENLPLPLSGIIVLSALTPLVVLLVIGLSVYAIRNLWCNCKCYKDLEIVEQNPVYGLGDDDDAIEATDANSIYGDEDDEYENIENA